MNLFVRVSIIFMKSIDYFNRCLSENHNYTVVMTDGTKLGNQPPFKTRIVFIDLFVVVVIVIVIQIIGLNRTA